MTPWNIPATQSRRDAAGRYVVALPHPQLPPSPGGLAFADVTLSGIGHMSAPTFGLR